MKWRLYLVILLTVGGALGAGAWMLVQRRTSGAATLAKVRAQVIPQAGEPTTYGLPLSLDNTQRFIDYHATLSLTPEQERVVKDALSPFGAPCCDDNPMSTCCCDCNLARSVWGLSGYLVAKRNYGVEQVRDSALKWLRFIQSDYYVGQELEDRGVNPNRYDLPRGDTCYIGDCELPFTADGCGGMGVLRQ